MQLAAECNFLLSSVRSFVLHVHSLGCKKISVIADDMGHTVPRFSSDAKSRFCYLLLPGGFIKKSSERKNQPRPGSIIFLGKSQESSQNPLLAPSSCIITSYMRRLLEIIYISSGDRRQLHKKIDFPLTFFHVNSSSVKRAFQFSHSVGKLAKRGLIWVK